MIVPAAMQPAVMLVKLGTRAAIVAMVANAARTQEIFFMVLLLSLLRQEKTSGASRRSRNCFGTFLNGYSAKLPLCHERNNRPSDELQNRVGSVLPDRHKKVGPSSP